MVDNISVTPGSGISVATDDVGGVQYQRVKPAVGTDGVAVDVSATNPMPEEIVKIAGQTPSLGNGAVAAGTLRVTLASDSAGILNTDKYETVAASQTAQVLGSTGATSDYISGLLVIPATTSPGAIALLDNATSITVFTGGASSVSNLIPFFIPLGIKSVSGAWKVTTGTNVSVIGIGSFT